MRIPAVVIEEFKKACREYRKAQHSTAETAFERGFEQGYYKGRANALGMILEEVYGLRDHDIEVLEEDAIGGVR